MNPFLPKGIGVILLFSYPFLEMNAQAGSNKFQVGLAGGVFVYQGDLTPSALGSYRPLKPTVNLFVNRIASQSFSLRTSLFYGSLMGNDAAYKSPDWRQQRNLAFTTKNLELSELLVWNAWSTQHRFVPYLFGGIGLSFLNIKRDWSRFNGEFFTSEDLSSRVAEDVAHNTPKLLPVLPVGIGIQYSTGKKLSVFGESAYRFTRTDYLDGFSKAGNPHLFDHYQNHTVGVIYKWGIKEKLNCPTSF